MSDQKKSKTKYFVVAGIIVIIVALILIVPRCQRYGIDRQSEQGKEALAELSGYVADYVKTHQSASGFSVEKALLELDVHSSVLKDWKFAIAWKPSVIYTQQMMEELKDVGDKTYVSVTPFKIIMATATGAGAIPEGRKIWLDGDANSYHGIGVDSQVEPDWDRIFPNP